MRDACKHFSGIQHDACKAGVRYRDVRDETKPYTAGRYPCLRRGESTPCASRQYPTAEEEAAEEAAWARAFAATEDGKCPTCGRELVAQHSERSSVLTCPEHGFVRRDCRRIGEPS